jgi:hypothetical protein
MLKPGGVRYGALNGKVGAAFTSAAISRASTRLRAGRPTERPRSQAPSADEVDGARYLGRRVPEIAAKVAA